MAPVESRSALKWVAVILLHESSCLGYKKPDPPSPVSVNKKPESRPSSPVKFCISQYLVSACSHLKFFIPKICSREQKALMSIKNHHHVNLCSGDDVFRRLQDNAWILTLLVLVAVLWGFFILGIFLPPAYEVRGKVMFWHESVCLSTLAWGGGGMYPIQPTGGYPIPGPGGGYPIQLTGGYPIPPIQDWVGYPPPGKGYPPTWTWDGVTPPPPPSGDRAA